MNTINKSLMSNIVALVVIVVGLVMDNIYILYAGLFAFSGAITNWLAIYMLFEKVPFLYGSGVIIDRFDAFKSSIKSMMMEQFFSKAQLEQFFEKEEKKLDLESLITKTDFSLAFDALSTSVMESKFGAMIGMFGGVGLLESLKEPFTQKIKDSIITISKSESFQQNLKQAISQSEVSDDLLVSVERLIDSRLSELTPLMVKEIVQRIIREHLGWLVVWGGVFGGLLGIVSAFLV